MIIFDKLFSVRLARLSTWRPTVMCRFSSTKSQMKEFYSGKNVFITGATGFLGKALLEKMLSAFPDIGRVYVLIRGKRNIRFNDRLEQLCKEPIFTKYRRVNVENLSKVVGIEGHIGDNGLQISEEDRNTLIEQVNVVFHIAASVRFDQPLDVAMKNIFLGSKTMLSLANEMRHLSSFVYVSTVYSNMQQSMSDEMVYDMKIDADSVMSLYKTNSKKDAEKLVWKNYFDGRPNTYVFTKGLTENYIRKHYGHLPVTIARPSIVAGALVEPEPGYCDSHSAASYGVLYQGDNLIHVSQQLTIEQLTGIGICRYQPLKENAIVDIIPIDVTVNSLLIVAREVALQVTPVTSVYNISSTSHWLQTQKQMADSKLKAFIRSPPVTALRPFSSRTTKISKVEQFVLKYFSELVFAILVDTISKIRGKKSQMLKLTRSIQSTRDVQTIFYQNSYFFPRKNMDTAIARLSEEDRKLFPALPIVNDNDEYWYKYWMSLREILLGENADNIDEAQRHQKRLKLRSQAVSLTMATTCLMMSALYFV